MAREFLSGLTEAEAACRLQEFGPNELSSGQGRSDVRIIGETMREPMFVLLLGAAVLYLVLGDLGEGLFLLGGAVASVGLVIFQEARSERALAALRELAQPHARVIREGVERLIPARALTPGDILLVGEGERLPADGFLAAGDILSVDESTLTGESAPVAKRPAPLEPTGEPTPGAEAGPFVFAGTLVVRGQGVVRVTRTGARSALGKIGSSLAQFAHEPTPLQKTAGRLVTLLGVIALGFCGLVAVAYGLLRGDWIEGALAGVTVAISLIPEEFPMVLAVFLAIGAWRLANHQVLARRSAAIEALGAASVLCVDKTGTLTENRMKVARVWTRTGDILIEDGKTPEAAAGELLKLAVMASAVRPVDPMDKAVHALAPGVLDEAGLDRVGGPERAWPLRQELLAVVQLWRLPEGRRIAAAKGAPEAIFRLCRLPEEEVGRLHGVIQRYAEQGLRVLGVASAPRGLGEEPLDVAFEFAGLVGFLDPLRSDAPAALAEASAAGIKVIMITGDHPLTALAIARSAGIDTTAGVITGPEIAALPFEALRDRLRSVRVFARIAPEQKLSIVRALKADGEVIAMTGDGVNDAPALEAAHIGVAMGRKGTDVAREAADLVLLDDSFASIVGGVRLGRRIFANLRRALTFITAVHVPIAGLALSPILLGLPPMLFPMHVVLLELIIDPTCSLVFEAERSEADAMRRPPRRSDEPLFGPRQIVLAMMQGASVLAAVLGVYVWAFGQVSEGEARGVAFVALVVGNLVLALSDSMSGGRLFAPERRILWGIIILVAAALTALLTIPWLARLFAVTQPSPAMLSAGVGVAVIAAGWTALLRVLPRERRETSVVRPQLAGGRS